MVNGISVAASQFKEHQQHGVCEPCTQAKQHRLPFPTSDTISTKPLQLIHMDVCGPLEETSRGGARYLATFLDDFSKLSTVEPVAQKSEVATKVKEVFHTPTQALQEMESRWTASIQADPTGRVRRRSDIPDSQPAWMSPSSGPRLHWSQRQLQQQEQHQQQQQQLQHAQQLPSDKAAINDTLDVLEACGSHPQQSEWRRLWELASSRYFDRRHRVLWWRILHGSLMCGAYKAYIHRATPEQACCPFSCCSSLSQPQTISHLFLECPAAATVISWLCRLWQAMTGHMPQASVATILAATTAEGQCASEALLQTWHRLRLAVLHSIFFFFFFFFFGRDGYSLHKCNDSNLKTM